MPHIIIEHSSNFDEKKILTIGKNIQKIMGDMPFANFDIDQCKIRGISFQNYQVGSSKIADFIHISIKILAGRSLEIRQDLSQQVFDWVLKYFQDNMDRGNRFDLSVDIIEMNREVYKKITIG
jgi:5-carboxymethyl-2-hydroxymuconate isomerase